MTSLSDRHIEQKILPCISVQILPELQVPSDSAGRNSKEAGFTLVELLVVMAILVLLASTVAPKVLGYLASSRTKVAKIQIENLVTSLELFKLDTGSFPSNSTGLTALTTRQSQRMGWNGPYIKGQRAPLDPWGTPYQYRSPGRYGEFDLFSLGADKKPGGTDESSDVTNW